MTRKEGACVNSFDNFLIFPGDEGAISKVSQNFCEKVKTRVEGFDKI